MIGGRRNHDNNALDIFTQIVYNDIGNGAVNDTDSAVFNFRRIHYENDRSYPTHRLRQKQLLDDTGIFEAPVHYQ